MLKEHKNRWLTLLGNAGLDPAQFDFWNESDLIFAIQLRNSPLTFKFRQFPDNFDVFVVNYSNYAPGYPMRATESNFLAEKTLLTIQAASDQFSNWLIHVVRRYLAEQETLDLWQQFNGFPFVPGTSTIPAEELKPFSEPERRQIADALQEFKRLVTDQIDPLTVQLDALNARIDYLTDRLDKLNRIDWKAQAFSTLVSIVVNLAVDTQTGNRLVELFKQALGFIAGLLPPGTRL